MLHLYTGYKHKYKETVLLVMHMIKLQLFIKSY